jgi:hypothetical protein
MPTPRHIRQVAAQGGRSATGVSAQQLGAPPVGKWLAANIASKPGWLSIQYDVDLVDPAAMQVGRVPASQAIDAELDVGVRVWVTYTGQEFVIVGMR